jgi:hypothetical protein
MTRTPLDPSLLGDDTKDAPRIDPWIARFMPGATALAERIFLREVTDAIAGPAEHALRSLLKDPSRLDRGSVAEPLAARIAAGLTAEEREGIHAHGNDIARTLGRATVDLWSLAVSEADGALRVDRAVPEGDDLVAAWRETAELLGLREDEADALAQQVFAQLRAEGAVVSLPLGLVLDARASDLWAHREGAQGALPEDVVRSGEQRRAPVSLHEERLKRGGR